MIVMTSHVIQQNLSYFMKNKHKKKNNLKITEELFKH